MGNTKDSVLKYFDNLLRTDATLQGLTSNPMRLYPVLAPKDTKFDYIVHDIKINDTLFSGFNQGQYILNIWHNDSKPSGIWAIKDRIITLVDIRSFTATDGSGNKDVYSCRTWYQDGDEIEEKMEDIWHYVLIFYIRLDRFREISNILNR